MIERAVTARVPFAWTAADEAYGDNGPLRAWLEDTRIRYVMPVSRPSGCSAAAAGNGPL